MTAAARKLITEGLPSIAWAWGKQAFSHMTSLSLVCGALWWAVGPRFEGAASVWAQEQAQVVLDKRVPHGSLEVLAKEQASANRLLGLLLCQQLGGVVRPHSSGYQCALGGKSLALHDLDALFNAAALEPSP